MKTSAIAILTSFLTLGVVACGAGSDGVGSASGSANGSGGVLGSSGASSAGAAGSLGNTSGLSGSGTSGNGPGGGIVGCNDKEVNYENVTPTVLLVVDRSSSMNDNNLWGNLRTALMSSGGVVERFQSEVRFGFMAYTSLKGISADAACWANDAALEPDGRTGGKVELNYFAANFNTYADLNSYYSGIEPPNDSDTPTAAALASAYAQLKKDPFQGPKYVLLVTDGQPDNCNDGDVCPPMDGVLAAVQKAYADGIGTFAVTLTSDAKLLGNVHDIAAAGTGLSVGIGSCSHVNPKQATYGDASVEKRGIIATDQATMETAFASIVGGVRTCSYKMSLSINLDKANLGTIQVDGTSYDYQTGWKVEDGTTDTVVLLGEACDKVTAVGQTPTVNISFPCDVFIDIQ